MKQSTLVAGAIMIGMVLFAGGSFATQRLMLGEMFTNTG